MQIKYKKESEFCKDVTELILGALIGIRKNVKCLAEVPRYSHNDHVDILLLDYHKKEGILIEYKLKDWKGLHNQVRSNKNLGIRSIGIINGVRNQEACIHNYTGLDYEIEKICDDICGVKSYWTDIYHNDKMNLYYWGYMNSESDLNGGLANCKRISQYQLYEMAVKNLLLRYGSDLDFYLVYRALGCYSYPTARKHYRNAVRSLQG